MLTGTAMYTLNNCDCNSGKYVQRNFCTNTRTHARTHLIATAIDFIYERPTSSRPITHGVSRFREVTHPGGALRRTAVKS